MQNQHDDEFEKMLQEFLENYSDSEFDASASQGEADSDSSKQRLTAVRDTEHEDAGEDPFVSATVEVQPGVFGAPYANGPVTVSIYGDKDAFYELDRFHCFIYADNAFSMCNSGITCKFSRPATNGVTIEMSCARVWLPGNYVLYIRDTDSGWYFRLPFTLDEDLQVSEGELEDGDLLDRGDILSDCIENHDARWLQVSNAMGTAQLRQYAIQHRQQEVYNNYRKGYGFSELNLCDNLLIATINDDFTDSVCHALKTIVACDHVFHPIDCATLFDAARNNPYETLLEELSVTDRSVFCLSGLGALLSTGGKVIVRKIMEKVRSNNQDFLLWLCGSQQDIDAVLNLFPSMRDLFPRSNRLRQEPSTAFEFIQAFMMALVDEHMAPSVEVMDEFSHAVLEHFDRSAVSGWSMADIRRYIAEEIRPRYIERGIEDAACNGIFPLLNSEDFRVEKMIGNSSSFEDCIRELNEMVGLDEVKQGITSMANNTRFYLERRRRGLPVSEKIARHCIFTGNPGTGKTTVARMLGRIYHSLGLLSKGEVIAVDRTRLVGRYIGETEENMKTILEEARGNVLFIDEAYTLYDGSSDRKDFGARVIDALLTVLSQPEPDMLIVFAGYLKEMDAMLSSNQGLQGRFPYKYQFKDYDAEQLTEIASRLLRRDEYILTDEAGGQLRKAIRQACENRSEHFSNARWVEQFVRNGIIPAMADRIFADGSNDYQHIEAADVCKAYEKFNPKAIELKPRRKVGFSA